MSFIPCLSPLASREFPDGLSSKQVIKTSWIVNIVATSCAFTPCPWAGLFSPSCLSPSATVVSDDLHPDILLEQSSKPFGKLRHEKSHPVRWWGSLVCLWGAPHSAFICFLLPIVCQTWVLAVPLADILESQENGIHLTVAWTSALYQRSQLFILQRLLNLPGLYSLERDWPTLG